jgi:hypothetical protein
MSHGGAAGKVVGMDWSRRPGDPTGPVVDVEGLSEMGGLGLDSNFVVVHGAGMHGSSSELTTVPICHFVLLMSS